jgi:2-iminobutanoate/2-iminopropanoate deaminase
VTFGPQVSQLRCRLPNKLNKLRILVARKPRQIRGWTLDDMIVGPIERFTATKIGDRTMRSRHIRVTTVLTGIVGLMLGFFAAAIPRDMSAQSIRTARRIVRPDRAPNTGLPFSPGVLAGNTLYISGHLGRDPKTNALVGGGIEAETRQSLANIREVLRAAGMDFKDVTAVTAYIASFDDFATFNAVYRRSLSRRPAGARDGAGRGAQRPRARRAADDRRQAVASAGLPGDAGSAIALISAGHDRARHSWQGPGWRREECRRHRVQFLLPGLQVSLEPRQGRQQFRIVGRLSTGPFTSSS